MENASGQRAPGCGCSLQRRCGKAHVDVAIHRLCGEIDEKVDAFLGHLLEGEWPYLWLDATYIKMRRGGHVGRTDVRSFLGTVPDMTGKPGEERVFSY
jgi:transposase-like protein